MISAIKPKKNIFLNEDYCIIYLKKQKGLEHSKKQARECRISTYEKSIIKIMTLESFFCDFSN